MTNPKPALFCAPALFHCRVHAVPDVENRVGQVKEDADRVLVAVDILRVFQDRVGNGAVVPRKELLVEDKPVNFRVPADSADVGGCQDLHESDLLAFPAFLGDIPAQLLIVRLVIQEHLRVAAHRHEVGGHLNNGIQLLHSFSVRSASEHGKGLLLN